MIWSQLKDYVKKKNVNYCLPDCENFAIVFFNTFNKVEWVKCNDHVKKVEDEYFKAADKIELIM